MKWGSAFHGMKWGSVGNPTVQKWVLDKAFDFESSFNGFKVIDFSQQHTEIPIFAVAAYLLFVFGVPQMVR